MRKRQIDTEERNLNLSDALLLMSLCLALLAFDLCLLFPFFLSISLDLVSLSFSMHIQCVQDLNQCGTLHFFYFHSYRFT